MSRVTSSDRIWNFSRLEVSEQERHIDRPHYCSNWVIIAGAVFMPESQLKVFYGFVCWQGEWITALWTGNISRRARLHYDPAAGGWKTAQPCAVIDLTLLYWEIVSRTVPIGSPGCTVALHLYRQSERPVAGANSSLSSTIVLHLTLQFDVQLWPGVSLLDCVRLLQLCPTHL